MKTVVIGLSGGVDSAVAAYRLKKEGYRVIAVFMRNWDSAVNNDFLGNPTLKNEICEQEKDYNDAVLVASTLGIELHRVDFYKEYWDKVFTYFLDAYKEGITPNPDVLCNNEIKFKAFIKYAETLNYDYIAMGHYARIEHKDSKSILLRALDSSKDQSYFLSMLDETQLSKVLFPIGDLKKVEVRQLAREAGLHIHDKKDSTGICFIGERNFKEFLKNYIPSQKGVIRNIQGKVLNEHEGVMFYTIGQRKGLLIGGTKESTNSWYVVGKDILNNELIVDDNKDSIYLYSNNCIIFNCVFRDNIDTSIEYSAKFRYREQDVKVNLEKIDEKTYKVRYLKDRAVTSGQVCAIYNDSICIGGGIIKSVYFDDTLREN
ncbi:MAG: tRNA 2-thiouridine(34) synthase MnmA [Acholeplasmatales bacterium]|jgi:tRNA-specific 2-thiouridylase|nr:tRNA 2-thiouridine(34) synthase MnmA [Acholeplasmatales bacterium]